MIDKKLNKLAWQNSKGYLLFCLSLIGGILIVAQAYLLAHIVNEVFLQNGGLGAVGGKISLLLAIFLARGLLSFAFSWLGNKLAREIKGQLRDNLLDKLATMGHHYLLEEKAGQVVTVISEGIDQLEIYFSKYLPQLIQGLTIPLLVLIVVFTQSKLSGTIMLLTAPFIPIFMVIIGNLADSKSQQQLSSMLRFSGHFLDVLQGLTTLKLFGQSKVKGEEIAHMSNQFRNATMEVLKIAFLSALMLEILATISTAMIAVEVGIRLVYGEQVFVTAFFILLLAPELYQPLKNLGSSFHAGRSSIAAAEQMWQLLDMKNDWDRWGEEEIKGELPPTIKLEQLTFKYSAQGKEVLKNINLTIRSGEKIAVVGKSGSGKTTLLKLILGLISPSEGRILINNRPLQQLSEKAWYQVVSYISQEPFLYAGSIKDNIYLSEPQATEEAFQQAVQQGGVAAFVKDWPQGYHTLVGEGGRGVSGGEKQRIAIARAFLKKAPIVIMDEATARLDLESEQLIQKGLGQLGENRTVIMVAHRLQTIVGADRIILLDNGQIAAIGTHEQLLNNSEIYRKSVALYGGGLWDS